jgi:hypothetical protein
MAAFSKLVMAHDFWSKLSLLSCCNRSIRPLSSTLILSFRRQSWRILETVPILTKTRFGVIGD